MSEVSHYFFQDYRLVDFKVIFMYFDLHMFYISFAVINHLSNVCFIFILDGNSSDEYIKTRCFIRDLFYVSKLYQNYVIITKV